MQPAPKTDARRYQRFLMEVEVNVYTQKSGLAPGQTLDISESGISAVVPLELFIGEAVKLDIRFPLEPVMVSAVVRSRNAFRYGFEFERPGTGKELIQRAPVRLSIARPM